MVDRSWLQSLLQRWQNGELTERQVHDEAEELFESREWPEYDETDDQSIAMEVLTSLDALNVQWITAADIPAIKKFLETPPGRAPQGWKELRRYWETLDLDERRAKLANDPFYSAVAPDR